MNIMSTDVHKINLCILNFTSFIGKRLFKRGFVKFYGVTFCFTEEPGLGAVMWWNTTEGQLGTTETAKQRLQSGPDPAIPVQRAGTTLRRQRAEVSTEQPGEAGLPAGAR
jgi:hypothetical protein